MPGPSITITQAGVEVANTPTADGGLLDAPLQLAKPASEPQ